MKKYRCGGNEKNWWVIEVQTDQVVAEGPEVRMRNLTTKLNSGAGFKGNTPAFLLHDFL